MQKPLPKADAIVVLGGSAVYKERTRKAAELFKQGISDKIILTNDGLEAGWSRTEQRNPYFVELAEKELLAHGVPAQNIEILHQTVASTKDEAILIGEESRKRGWKSVQIVTSGYHSRRSLWLFELYSGLDNWALGVVSPPPGELTPEPFYWWFSRRGWNFVGGEYLKSAYYLVFTYRKPLTVDT